MPTNRGEGEMEMNTMTAVELIRQAHPEVLTGRTGKDSQIAPPGAMAGMLIGSVFGFALWVGIILLLLSVF